MPILSAGLPSLTCKNAGDISKMENSEGVSEVGPTAGDGDAGMKSFIKVLVVVNFH